MQALSRAHDMEGYVALAASGDHHSHAKAAALAKLLAGVAGAYMVPVAGVCLSLPRLHVSLHS